MSLLPFGYSHLNNVRAWPSPDQADDCTSSLFDRDDRIHAPEAADVYEVHPESEQRTGQVILDGRCINAALCLHENDTGSAGCDSAPCQDGSSAPEHEP